MFKWLQRICEGPADADVRPEATEHDRLLAERCRMEEMLATYREFGFESMAEEYRARLAEINHRLRRIQCRPMPPSPVSRE